MSSQELDAMYESFTFISLLMDAALFLSQCLFSPSTDESNLARSQNTT